MAFVPVDIQKCTHCGEAVEIRVAGVCSGLGPPKRICRRCGEVVASDRREWPFMSRAQRARFVAWSLAYLFIAGGVGGGILQATVNVIRNGFRDGWMPQVDIKQPVFWVGFVLWFASIGVVQLVRIIFSAIRSHSAHENAHDEVHEPLFVLQFGWHIPIAVLLALPLFIGWAVALVAK